MRITDRDRELLEFAAEHRLILARHAAALMETTRTAAYQRLGAVSKEGLLSRRTVFHNEPGCYQITRAGLAAIGSDLPRPQLDLRGYRHDVGIAWLWLAARTGVFGELERIVSEREMRSSDGRSWSEPAAGLTVQQAVSERIPGFQTPEMSERHGVRLGGLGPAGKPKLHYPDLVLVTRDCKRIAIELELTSKSRRRRETILAGYAADRRIDAVLYLSEDPNVRRAIASSAQRLGVSSVVHVQRLHWSGARASAAVASERSHGRSAPRERAR